MSGINKNIFGFSDRESNFSRRFLLIVLVIYTFNTILSGKIFSIFALQPSAMLEKIEFWRLLTFSFAPSSIEGLILFFFTFLLFAPRVEKFFHKKLFPIVLLLVVCLQGTILSLAFWKSNFIFSGMEGLSFYLLTLFTFFYIKDKVNLMTAKLVPAYTLSLLILTAWSVSLVSHYYYSGNISILICGISNAIFGIVSGSITYLQIRFTKQIISNKPELSNIEIPKPEELTPALISTSELKKMNKNFGDELYRYQHEAVMSEDKLNEILDKIIDYGSDSLSPDERRYLENYSKEL